MKPMTILEAEGKANEQLEKDDPNGIFEKHSYRAGFVAGCVFGISHTLKYLFKDDKNRD